MIIIYEWFFLWENKWKSYYDLFSCMWILFGKVPTDFLSEYLDKTSKCFTKTV